MIVLSAKYYYSRRILLTIIKRGTITSDSTPLTPANLKPSNTQAPQLIFAGAGTGKTTTITAR